MNSVCFTSLRKEGNKKPLVGVGGAFLRPQWLMRNYCGIFLPSVIFQIPFCTTVGRFFDVLTWIKSHSGDVLQLNPPCEFWPRYHVLNLKSCISLGLKTLRQLGMRKSNWIWLNYWKAVLMLSELTDVVAAVNYWGGVQTQIQSQTKLLLLLLMHLGYLLTVRWTFKSINTPLSEGFWRACVCCNDAL